MIMFRVGVRVRVEQKTYPLSDIFLPLLGEGKTSEREMSGGELSRGEISGSKETSLDTGFATTSYAAAKHCTILA